MSQIAPPPNPCLLAIILIVQGREGPRFVFHYPPDPLTAQTAISLRQTREDQGIAQEHSESESDDDSRSASEDEHKLNSEPRPKSRLQKPQENELLLSSAKKRYKITSAAAEEEAESSSLSEGDRDSTWKPPWDSFLSIHTSALAKLLNPSRSWHKRRFEVGINELCFIGWPVFIREDGTWQKKKKQKKRPRAWNENLESAGASFVQSTTQDTQNEKAASYLPTEKSNDVAQDNQRPSHLETENPTKNSMKMFNMVFVMNPPVLEYSLRVREMYDNVVKKLGKALKWEQARADYVWKEAKAILKLKEKAREKQSNIATLYAEILSSSSLAKAMASIFITISTNRIASATFPDAGPISFQIPPVTSTAVLPSATDPPTQRGLWLTTADSVSEEQSGDPGPSIHLAKHFALLLLDNEASILKDIEASGGSLAAPLAHYIRSSSPTKSFAQISVAHNISLADIQLLARHLVFWRRARAVPPLHQRDTYIVSPNADLAKLNVASRAYETTFPTLPGLPKMLSALSGSPRPYASLIPSKDHKEMYFLILAWLLRGGWVTQLRTFAWIRVDEEVKRRARNERTANGSFSNGVSIEGEVESPPSVYVPETYQNVADNGSNWKRQHRNENEDSGRSLILRPQRATPAESAWIDQIGEDFTRLSQAPLNLTDADVQELQTYWPAFRKYFLGSQALEKIPVRENLKRKRVWNMLGKLGLFDQYAGSGRRGPLLGVRHW
ncbi:MAG: hypothetical protein Q9227_006390 [Pyrenula ochraceoflavens]